MGAGGKGRPTKPRALKLVDGDRADRLNDKEPIPSEGEVIRPEWLSPAAVEFWDRLAPDLIGKGVLTPWDVQAFAEWCTASATVVEAESYLAVEGHVIEADVFDRNGKPTGARRVRNEWSRVWQAAMEVSARRAAQFGFTPAARGSIQVLPADAAEGKDPARFLL